MWPQLGSEQYLQECGNHQSEFGNADHGDQNQLRGVLAIPPTNQGKLETAEQFWKSKKVMHSCAETFLDGHTSVWERQWYSIKHTLSEIMIIRNFKFKLR